MSKGDNTRPSKVSHKDYMDNWDKALGKPKKRRHAKKPQEEKARDIVLRCFRHIQKLANHQENCLCHTCKDFMEAWGEL